MTPQSASSLPSPDFALPPRADGSALTLLESIDSAFDWQWLAHAWSKQDSPATALRHYLAGSSDEVVLGWLEFGARDQSLVREGSRAFESVEGFLLRIATAAPSSPTHWVQAEEHLEWQAHNDPLSLRMGLESLSDAGTERQQIAFAYHVASGQSHNGAACQVYRSCLRDSIPMMVQLVQAALAGASRPQQLEVGHPGRFRDRVGPQPGLGA